MNDAKLDVRGDEPDVGRHVELPSDRTTIRDLLRRERRCCHGLWQARLAPGIRQWFGKGRRDADSCAEFTRAEGGL